MGKWIPSSGQWPSVVPVGMWRWFPGHLCSHLLCAYFMPHAELDAGVTIMNKASSLPAREAPKVQANKEHGPKCHPCCAVDLGAEGGACFHPCTKPLSPASLPFSLMWVTGATMPLLYSSKQEEGGEASLSQGLGVSDSPQLDRTHMLLPGIARSLLTLASTPWISPCSVIACASDVIGKGREIWIIPIGLEILT